MSDVLRKRKRSGPAAALSLFRQVARANPRDAYARYLLAKILDNLGRESSAIPHYHRALRLNPRHRRAYENYLYLASSYYNVGKPEAARRYLAEAQTFRRSNWIQRRLEDALAKTSPSTAQPRSGRSSR